MRRSRACARRATAGGYDSVRATPSAGWRIAARVRRPSHPLAFATAGPTSSTEPRDRADAGKTCRIRSPTSALPQRRLSAPIRRDQGWSSTQRASFRSRRLLRRASTPMRTAVAVVFSAGSALQPPLPAAVLAPPRRATPERLRAWEKGRSRTRFRTAAGFFKPIPLRDAGGERWLRALPAGERARRIRRRGCTAASVRGGRAPGVVPYAPVLTVQRGRRRGLKSTSEPRPQTILGGRRDAGRRGQLRAYAAPSSSINGGAVGSHPRCSAATGPESRTTCTCSRAAGR